MSEGLSVCPPSGYPLPTSGLDEEGGDVPTSSRVDRDERPRRPAQTHHGTCIEAALTIRAALERHRPELERDGSPAEVYERVRLRLDDLVLRSGESGGADDLQACSDSWVKLESELGLLQGPARDRLVRLLAARRPGNAGDALSEIHPGGGDNAHPDEQGLDPAALDTRIGSGEATDLFSLVSGGFLFRATRSGDGADGKLLLEQASLGAGFDSARRLDGTTLSRMEQALDGDFAGVRIHTGSAAAEMAGLYGAEAFTVQDHIFFAPGRFNPNDAEGQRLLAHELTHVLQKGRKNLDVRTAETEAIHAERSFGRAPPMETLNLSQPQPDFRLADGEGEGTATIVQTAKRSRSRGYEAGGKDELPDGEEFLEKVSDRVYALLMDELEQSFESR